MADEMAEELEMHPLIKAQELNGEPTVEFRGFVGAGDDRMIRLYADLSMSSYVDIPREGLVYIGKDPSGETGRARVFVRPGQEVQAVSRRTTTASSLSVNAFPNPDRFPQPEHGGYAGCLRRCEATFADQAAVVVRKRNAAVLACTRFGDGSLQCAQASAAAIDAESMAVGFLLQSVADCRKDNPPILGYPSVTGVVANIASKYLGVAT